MPDDKVFEGDFLFVNHNAKHMKAATHRKQVFSHVQNKYRTLKRKEDNRALKASINTSLAERRKPSDKAQVAEDIRSVPVHIRQATLTQKSGGEHHSTKLTIQSLIIEDGLESTESALVKLHTESLLGRLISPSTLLREGNSDPFDTYAVKIDPLANEVLTFRRDFVLPAIYHTTKRKWMTIATARRGWEHCIHGWGASGGLGDEGSGTAFLATCATVAALVSRNPAVHQQAMQYRSKSITLLKDRLAAGDCCRAQLYWHMNIMIDVETHNRNRDNAATHLIMLRKFFERDGEEVDAELLLHVIYHDIHISSMFLTRPIFDMDRWVPARFQILVDAAEAYLPDLSEAKSRFLDSSIDNPKLRALFLERRESLAVWLVQRSSADDSEASCALLAWLQVRVYLHQGRLVNLFLQAETRYKAGLPPQLMDSLACQGYISLATLLYIRAISFNATVHGVRLYDATATILRSMQEMLECSERPDSPNYAKYENARLWALYVGSSAETFMGIRPREGAWFTTNFARKAVRLGIGGDDAWDKMRQVLRGFLYTDLMHPDGAGWFEQVLRIAKGSGTFVKISE